MNGGVWPISSFAGLHILLERWIMCPNCSFGQGEFCGNFPFVCNCRDTIHPVCVSICCKLLVGIHHLGMLDYKCVNIPWLQNEVIFIPHFFLFFSFLEDLVIYCHINLLADTWPELGCRLEPSVLTSCDQAFWENKVFMWIQYCGRLRSYMRRNPFGRYSGILQRWLINVLTMLGSDCCTAYIDVMCKFRLKWLNVDID